MEQKTDLQIAQEIKEKINLLKTLLAEATKSRYILIDEEIIFRRILNDYLNQSKSNLEGLGCGKLSIINEIEKELLPITKDNSFTGDFDKDCMIGQLLASAKFLLQSNNEITKYLIDNALIENFESSKSNFSPDCLAKGIDKAKKIYEGILNLNSEEDGIK